MALAIPGRSPNQVTPVVGAASAGSSSGSIRIEHTRDGTLVSGTDKNDHAVRQALKDHNFRWSRRLEAWYLPRPWSYGARSVHVDRLTQRLTQLGRDFTSGEEGKEQAAPALATSGNEENDRRHVAFQEKSFQPPQAGMEQGTTEAVPPHVPEPADTKVPTSQTSASEPGEPSEQLPSDGGKKFDTGTSRSNGQVAFAEPSTRPGQVEQSPVTAGTESRADSSRPAVTPARLAQQDVSEQGALFAAPTTPNGSTPAKKSSRKQRRVSSAKLAQQDFEQGALFATTTSPAAEASPPPKTRRDHGRSAHR